MREVVEAAHAKGGAPPDSSFWGIAPDAFGDGANPLFTGNVFQDVNRDGVDDLSDGARALSARDNWFVDDVRSTSSAPPRIRRGR